MSHTFEVGEIAVIAAFIDHPERMGWEVEIIGPLQNYWVRPIHRESYMKFGYQVRLPQPDALGRINACYGAHELRKRRPPQDWVKLCNLTDVPREVTCA